MPVAIAPSPASLPFYAPALALSKYSLFRQWQGGSAASWERERCSLTFALDVRAYARSQDGDSLVCVFARGARCEGLVVVDCVQCAGECVWECLCLGGHTIFSERGQIDAAAFRELLSQSRHFQGE
jgi:hypothetical protein